MTKLDPSETLQEGFDAQQKLALGDLHDVAEHLAAWQAPEPTAQERSALIQALVPQLPPSPAPVLGIQGWLRLFLAQVRLFEVEFWYACGIMLVFIVIGGLLAGGAGLTLFTLMGSPLIAICGVMYVYHRESSSLAALEAVSPVGRWALFSCRSALILGMNFVALPLLLIPGEILFPQIAFWRVVVIWLGVLVGLFGLATWCTMRWNGLIGSILPLGIWGVLVAVSWQDAMAYTSNIMKASDWLIKAIANSNGLLVGALLAVVLGGWLLFRAGNSLQAKNDLCA